MTDNSTEADLEEWKGEKLANMLRETSEKHGFIAKWPREMPIGSSTYCDICQKSTSKPTWVWGYQIGACCSDVILPRYMKSRSSEAVDLITTLRAENDALVGALAGIIAAFDRALPPEPYEADPEFLSVARLALAQHAKKGEGRQADD